MLIPEVDPLSKTTTQCSGSISKKRREDLFFPFQELSWWGQTVIGYVCDILIFGGGVMIISRLKSALACLLSAPPPSPGFKTRQPGGRRRGRRNERGVWLFGPALFYNHFDQSTINDQWRFLSWKPLSNLHIMLGTYFKMSPLLQKWNSLDPDRVWSTCGAAGVEVHPSNSPLGPPCLSLSCPQPQ